MERCADEFEQVVVPQIFGVGQASDESDLFRGRVNHRTFAQGKRVGLEIGKGVAGQLPQRKEMAPTGRYARLKLGNQRVGGTFRLTVGCGLRFQHRGNLPIRSFFITYRRGM